jgi:hypothetical protein
MKSKFNTLCKWVTNNGGHVSGVNLICFNTGLRGLAAAKRIQSNCNIFVIPHNLYLSPSTDNRLSAVQHADIALCGKLLLEISDTDSFWKPYIDILPPVESFSEHPIIKYDTENTHWNLLCPVFSEVIYHYKKIILTAHQLLSQIPELKNVTFDDVQYAMLLVFTRSFNGQLIPVADLLNHKINTHTSVEINNTTCTYNTNDKCFLKGQQIFGRYMVTDNLQMLSRYGFIGTPSIIKLNNTNTDDLMWISETKISESITQFINQTDKNDDIQQLICLINNISHLSICSISEYENFIKFEGAHNVTKLLCVALIEIINICNNATVMITNNCNHDR